MRFRHRIALKPAKTCSTQDFTIRKQYEEKLTIQKKSWIFQFLYLPGTGTVEISCFQKQIRGKGVIGPLSVHIQ